MSEKNSESVIENSLTHSNNNLETTSISEIRSQELIRTNGFESTTKDTLEEFENTLEAFQDNYQPRHIEKFTGGALGFFSFPIFNLALQGNLPALYSGPTGGVATGALQALGTGIASFGVTAGYLYRRGKQTKELGEKLNSLRDDKGILTTYFYPEKEEITSIIEDSEFTTTFDRDFFSYLNESNNPEDIAQDYNDIMLLLEERNKFWREAKDPKHQDITLNELERGNGEHLTELAHIPDFLEEEYEAVLEDFRDEFTQNKENSSKPHPVLRHFGIEHSELGDAVVYRLEIYCGDDLTTYMDGIIDEDKFFGYLESDFAAPTI